MFLHNCDFTFQGKTIKPKRHLLGNNGLVEFGNDVDLVTGFDKWVQNGFPHHVCVVEGKCAEKITKFAEQHDVIVL